MLVAKLTGYIMFKVRQIDHVHVAVRDRASAAEWYVRTLGLEHDLYFSAWSEDRGAPLMLKTNSGHTAVALFERSVLSVEDRSTIAFSTDAENFLALLRSPELGNLRNSSNQPLSRHSLVDHKLCLSIYFCDPDGNPIEITTQERTGVLAALDEK